MAEAGRSTDGLPTLALDRLIRLKLASQDTIGYVAPASKTMLTDGAFGGMARLRTTSAGLYRVSVDRPLWIDMVVEGKTIQSADFSGAHTCEAPRKVVVYPLPARTEVVLQLGSADTDEVRPTLPQTTTSQH